MARSAFTLAETAAKALMRQALWRKVKDNDDDHEARVLSLESSFKLLEHFNLTAPSGFSELLPPLWEQTYSGGTIAYPAFSAVRITSAASVQWYGIIYRRPFRFDLVTPPIRLKVRMKRSSNTQFRVGMKLPDAGGDLTGIWLEYVDASNWRFRSYDTAINNGTSFANVALNTWFEVEIIFTNSPSNQALCYLDGALKETLTTQLPTAKQLYAIADFFNGGAGESIQVDRVDWSAAAALDAA